MAYTDFADELFARGTKQGQVPAGVRVASASKENITVTRVEILRSGLARPKGRYITVETPSISILDERDAAVIDTAAEQLRSLLPPKGKILVVGVGNRRVTADAIGPRTAQKVLMTAHIAQDLPNVRPVYVVSPGVSGATGIPLGHLIASLVDTVKPSAVICVDSLVSTEPARLGCTIQFSDTGLCPSSYHSEKRITPAQLGVPVIAAGIPTLMEVDEDVLQRMQGGAQAQFSSQTHNQNWAQHQTQNQNQNGAMPPQSQGEAQHAPQGISQPPQGTAHQNLVMVPRTLDQTISHGSALLGAAINRALQPSFSLAQLCWLAH